MVRSTAQGALMSSETEDRTEAESGMGLQNRASRACGNTRTTRGCFHPPCKAIRETTEDGGPSWGLRP